MGIFQDKLVRGVAGGVASLNQTGEVVQLPAGAAASGAGRVLHGNGSFNIAGKMLQMVEHKWTNSATNTSTTWQLVTGSTFSFKPKSPTSMLYVEMNLHSHIYMAGGDAAGGRYAIHHSGAPLHVINTAATHEHYMAAGGAATMDNYTRISKVATVHSISTAARNIEVMFSKYIGTYINVNYNNSFESYIRVIEVEA